MSDCRKSLLAVVDKIYPQAVHGYCCQHLTKNVETNNFSKEYKRLFWCAAFAESEVVYDAVLVKIQAKDLNCHNYLRAIPDEQWATHAFL